MPKKVDGYERERLDTLKKYLEILGINENNKEICLNEIDKDEEKLRRLEEMDGEIRKYYLTSGWVCYSRKLDRKYYSVLKYMMKEFNINFNQKTITTKKKMEEGIMNYKKMMLKVDI